MEISPVSIDNILLDLERLPPPHFEKVDRGPLKNAMSRFLKAPGMMLPITARQIMIRCKRCGECCRYCNSISIDHEECSAIARHLGIDGQPFKERYIDVLPCGKDGKDGRSCEVSLVIKKENGMHCPFYDRKKGCGIYEVRPTACRVFPYLQGDIVAESVNNGRVVCFSNCPAAIELDNEIKAMSRSLRSNPDIYIYARSRVNDIDIMLIYVLNAFLWGMENSDGLDIVHLWMDKLGMSRLATEEELYRISLLVCGIFMGFSGQK